MTGSSLYYPRVLMRTLAQVLTEEYSEHGVQIANVIIDGTIDSPGPRAMKSAQANPDRLIDPARIEDAFYYLHTQHPSCWTHEIRSRRSCPGRPTETSIGVTRDLVGRGVAAVAADVLDDELLAKTVGLRHEAQRKESVLVSD